MTSDIWNNCRGNKHIIPLQQDAWRVVEDQHNSATRKLVDSLEEHDILEDIIEQVKPKLPEKNRNLNLHYLLATPFRYPPLQHGSRFGKVFEPSLWYGSIELITAFAETAYYRILFLTHTTAKLNMVQTKLSAFPVVIKTNKGIDLSIKPFNKFTKLISSKTNYYHSQALGSVMRAQGVEAFLYYSARDTKQRLNIALFTPMAFKNPTILQNTITSWDCYATTDYVEFSRHTYQKEYIKFDAEEFMQDHQLPIPTAYVE